MFWKGISQGISTAEMRLELLILKWIFEKSTYKLAQDECAKGPNERESYVRTRADLISLSLSLSLSLSSSLYFPKSWTGITALKITDFLWLRLRKLKLSKQWPLTKISAIRMTMTLFCTLHVFWALLLYLINAIKRPHTILETIPANTRRWYNVTI